MLGNQTSFREGRCYFGARSSKPHIASACYSQTEACACTINCAENWLIDLHRVRHEARIREPLLLIRAECLVVASRLSLEAAHIGTGTEAPASAGDNDNSALRISICPVVCVEQHLAKVGGPRIHLTVGSAKFREIVWVG